MKTETTKLQSFYGIFMCLIVVLLSTNCSSDYLEGSITNEFVPSSNVKKINSSMEIPSFSEQELLSEFISKALTDERIVISIIDEASRNSETGMKSATLPLALVVKSFPELYSMLAQQQMDYLLTPRIYIPNIKLFKEAYNDDEPIYVFNALNRDALMANGDTYTAVYELRGNVLKESGQEFKINDIYNSSSVFLSYRDFIVDLYHFGIGSQSISDTRILSDVYFRQEEPRWWQSDMEIYITVLLATLQIGKGSKCEGWGACHLWLLWWKVFYEIPIDEGRTLDVMITPDFYEKGTPLTIELAEEIPYDMEGVVLPIINELELDVPNNKGELINHVLPKQYCFYNSSIGEFGGFEIRPF